MHFIVNATPAVSRVCSGVSTMFCVLYVNCSNKLQFLCNIEYIYNVYLLNVLAVEIIFKIFRYNVCFFIFLAI